MKKIFLPIGCLSLMFIVGCTKSVLTIENISSTDIICYFMGKAYPVAVGGTVEVKDVPYSSYSYSSRISCHPMAKTMVLEDGLSGMMMFYDTKTNYLLSYSGNLTYEDKVVNNVTVREYTYHSHALLSSNVQLGSTPTSP